MGRSFTVGVLREACNCSRKPCRSAVVRCVHGRRLARGGVGPGSIRLGRRLKPMWLRRGSPLSTCSSTAVPAVVTVCGACHLRYRCATAAKATLGSHSMSGYVCPRRPSRSDDAQAGLVQVVHGVAVRAVRAARQGEQEHERAVHALVLEDLQQFAQICGVAGLVALVYAVQPDRGLGLRAATLAVREAPSPTNSPSTTTTSPLLLRP